MVTTTRGAGLSPHPTQTQGVDGCGLGYGPGLEVEVKISEEIPLKKDPPCISLSNAFDIWVRSKRFTGGSSARTF
ncbi:hypothetical protein L6452_33019 [Arctium lappa]|uniref:Uncharacterized protein n=1 Tax=Arctium lappa TaxID=4217 RepID=A0ACB8Z6K8_ARCLA|nr:hypothetical protein L6452_33019 [Arctium lappa]